MAKISGSIPDCMKLTKEEIRTQIKLLGYGLGIATSMGAVKYPTPKEYWVFCLNLYYDSSYRKPWFLISNAPIYKSQKQIQ